MATTDRLTQKLDEVEAALNGIGGELPHNVINGGLIDARAALTLARAEAGLLRSELERARTEGAEAMRAACAKVAWDHDNDVTCDAIRDLPIPTDPGATGKE